MPHLAARAAAAADINLQKFGFSDFPQNLLYRLTTAKNIKYKNPDIDTVSLFQHETKVEGKGITSTKPGSVTDILSQLARNGLN